MSETTGTTPPQRCTFCGDRLGGGPGGWWSIADGSEVCRSGTSVTTFHETDETAA